eukprot:CCRYP_013167-RA/>CCRYP_013167-RA protein AED:0.02 eAED:0.02 QI:340/1/1/1/1/1/3/271/1192
MARIPSIRGRNFRSAPNSNSGSGNTKLVVLLSFSALLVVGTTVYLRALSVVSGGLNAQMGMYERMMNQDRAGQRPNGRQGGRRKRDDRHPSLRREDFSAPHEMQLESDPRMSHDDADDDPAYPDNEHDDSQQETEPIQPILENAASSKQQNPPPTPPWHLASDPDDSFERIYLTPSEKKLYKNLRNLGKGGNVNKGNGIKSYFNPMCRHYRFDESMLPTVSVIMTTQNEPDDWVSISVESILARTPPHLLVEVIIVDDNGIPGEHGLPDNIRRNVDESEFVYLQSLSPKVKIVKHSNREGCARSRLAGARVATGEVLMFVDSHVEMLSATWYHHLAIAIVENPKTIAMQTIDVIDDLGTKDYGAGAGPLQYGIVNTEFWFGYQVDRFGDYMEPLYPQNFTKEEIDERAKFSYKAERPGNREPYETPFGPGSLFAIRADEFWRLGGYDEGLYVWGGENTELAFKIWMCGGRMIMVPCSRVGHMYRQHKEKDGRGALTRWPPDLPQEMTDRLGCAYKNGTYTGRFIVLKHPADNFTRITTRNNLRVMETWVGDHPAKRAYYKRLFGQETLKPEFQRFIDDWKVDPAAQKQVRIREENKCHDFEWWDKYVYMRLTGRHYPWHPDNKKYLQVSCGNHKAKSCALCPQGHGKDWCHGDCAWCSASDQCVDFDEAKKPQCRKSALSLEAAKKARKAEEKKAEEKKRERAKLPAGFDKYNLTISVVLPCGFEHEFFIRTAQSVFDETPDGILKEIVIVDDASDPPLKLLWSEEEAAKYSVKYVRLDSPAGLIGAKQAGAEAATGDIIVFFDCHVKPAKDYWVPYVKAIDENYRRVVIPVITSLNVDTWEEFNRPTSGGGMSKCYLTFDAEFKWTTDETPHVPIMSGGLLAMSRRWFFEIGGYDASMLGWGGENLDQSLRIWTCGGEIVSAPDSFVAHMWRDGTAKTKAKYKLGAGDAIKNRARAVKAHLGPWYGKTLTFPSFDQWRGRELDTSSITDGIAKLGCHDFEWYLDRFSYIYKDAGVLPKEVFQIEASSIAGAPQCLQLKKMGWTNYGNSDELELVDCLDGPPKEPKPQYWHLSSRLDDKTCCGSLRAWNTDQCIDGRSPKIGETKVSTYTCDLDSGIEAVLKPKNDREEEYVLALGRGTQHGVLCASVEDSALKIVGCANASTWKKRSPFTPLEYELLSADTKKKWENTQQP